MIIALVAIFVKRQMRHVMRSLIFTLLLLFRVWHSGGQSNMSVTMKQERVNTAAEGYYITGITDDRTNKEVIGHVDGGEYNNGSIILVDGIAQSMERFIGNNLAQDKSGQPVSLHIEKFNVSAKKKGAQWEITTETNFVFYAAGNKLVEYISNGKATRNDSPDVSIENYIRKTVDKDIAAFNKWWAENKDKVITSDTMLVRVTVARSTDKPGLIVYSTQRPLQIADFTGPVAATDAEMASTLSVVFINTSGTIEKGRQILNVLITPYFDTKGSWFKENLQSTELLAHEQAHFDIRAIKACELADSIGAATFTLENYEKLLHRLQQENSDAANDEQIRYDTETAHGTIKNKQEEWQRMLKENLETTSCY